MSAIYQEEYYKSKNYTHYIKRGTETDHYDIMASETIDLLKKLNREVDNILDFGCGLGFMMRSLSRYATNVVGVDISDFALQSCREKKLTVTTEPDYSQSYDVVYALDVLEHLSEDDLVTFFENIKAKTVVYKLPVAEETNGKYVLECAEVDETHQIRWTHKDWFNFFDEMGYFCIDVNLTNIYASEGGFCGIAIKYN